MFGLRLRDIIEQYQKQDEPQEDPEDAINRMIEKSKRMSGATT